MNLTLRNLLLSKNSLKVNALILGYWLWYIMSFNQLQTITTHVPLCFYGNSNVAVEAPDTISVTLFGYKSDLLLIDYRELAVHINNALLSVGKYPITITHSSLFLPERIKLLHYAPSPVIISVVNKDQNLAKEL